NIQTGAERMPHDLSHLGFLAGQIGRLITISTTPVIAGDSFEMDAVGALRLSPLRRGLAIDSTVDIFTFYVPHRHVYGEQWIILNTFLFGVIILIANILKRAFSSQLAAKLRNRLLVLYKPFFVPFGAVVYSVINIKLGEHIVALCQFIH